MMRVLVLPFNNFSLASEFFVKGKIYISIFTHLPGYSNRFSLLSCVMHSNDGWMVVWGKIVVFLTSNRAQSVISGENV